MPRKALLAMLMALMALTELMAPAAGWTIDLPEARRYLFEKNSRLELARQRAASDRPAPYAREHSHRSYSEQKVRAIVDGGSAYLQGLQRALETYSDSLQNCSSALSTAAGVWRPNAQWPADSNGTAAIATDVPDVPDAPDPSDPSDSPDARCVRVTRAREHVRRLADLAVKTTEELRDINYSKRHLKAPARALAQQENEQVLRLAWLLDRLAHLTGYRPRIEPAEPPPAPRAAPAAPALAFPPETTRFLMNCLKQRSDEPATVRCTLPQEPPAAEPSPAEPPSRRRRRRSLTYELDVDEPRAPADPYRDISYYAKNAPGRRRRPQLAQAALVRAGLALAFANPPLPTVQRYGSNFNPLVLDPLLAGGLRASADV